MDRQDQIVQMIQQISALPDGELKKSMSKSLAENLTLKETMELGIVFKSFRDDPLTPYISIQDAEFLDILWQVYEFLDIDLNMIVKDVPPELSEKMDQSAPLMKELGSVLKKLKTIYS